MSFEAWGDIFATSFQEIGQSVLVFIPKLFIALVIFIVGWVAAVILGRVVGQVLRSLKVDNGLKSMGVEDLLSRAGFRLDTGRFVGELVKWFIIVVFLIATLDIFKLTQVTEFLQSVVLGYIPQVIVAALILIIAAIIADVAQKIVVGAARAADIAQAPLLGGIAKWAIWVTAILTALTHLGIAGYFAQTLFTGVIVALSIAFGLAFGLGGQGAAGEFLQKLKRDINH